jgi:hypothetical protein
MKSSWAVVLELGPDTSAKRRQKTACHSWNGTPYEGLKRRGPEGSVGNGHEQTVREGGQYGGQPPKARLRR